MVFVGEFFSLAITEFNLSFLMANSLGIAQRFEIGVVGNSFSYTIEFHHLGGLSEMNLNIIINIILYRYPIVMLLIVIHSFLRKTLI